MLRKFLCGTFVLVVGWGLPSWAGKEEGLFQLSSEDVSPFPSLMELGEIEVFADVPASTGASKQTLLGIARNRESAMEARMAALQELRKRKDPEKIQLLFLSLIRSVDEEYRPQLKGLHRQRPSERRDEMASALASDPLICLRGRVSAANMICNDDKRWQAKSSIQIDAKFLLNRPSAETYDIYAARIRYLDRDLLEMVNENIRNLTPYTNVHR